MDAKAIDRALVSIIEKKAQLSGLFWDDKRYDEVEDELRKLEDELVDSYGDDLTEILEAVYDGMDVVGDVQLPTLYLAKTYSRSGQTADGMGVYDVRPGEGFRIETDRHAGKFPRLVLIPNPLRVVLQVDGGGREVVWQAK